MTAILRNGARRLLAQAVEAEAEAFLATMREVQLADGRDRLVRHGHPPLVQSRTQDAEPTADSAGIPELRLNA